MSQEMNQLPIRHSASSATASTLAGAAGGAIKGAAKGVLYAVGLVVGLPLLGAVIGGTLALGGGIATGALIGAGLGFVPAATVVAGGAIAAGLGWLGLNVSFLSVPLGIAAATFGALGLVKGGKEAHTRVQEQTANANVLDANLQAAAMDAQARVLQAQAYHQPQRTRHAAPAAFHEASPHVQASNDNEHHGTVAHAPERHVGHA